MTAHALDSPPTVPGFVGKQIELFAIRAAEIFEHVLTGKMLICDATDVLHDAAVYSGLEDAIGPDNVQRLMCAAFASASASHDRRP